ncbi:hypothetical protein HRI_001591800 [Hibiscus trionum]|uniref:Uncharacterized protein n=1 Tax=Hibiscus trionum TaxID=183268 RepID=A0A9W7HNS5_HIBTR|nr:hypothetical protein HRI_001591800 [Hibiscus trionum]
MEEKDFIAKDGTVDCWTCGERTKTLAYNQRISRYVSIEDANFTTNLITMSWFKLNEKLYILPVPYPMSSSTPTRTASSLGSGAARTQAPTATNYDVGSPTSGDLRQAPLPSAMEVASLGHGTC